MRKIFFAAILLVLSCSSSKPIYEGHQIIARTGVPACDALIVKYNSCFDQLIVNSPTPPVAMIASFVEEVESWMKKDKNDAKISCEFKFKNNRDTQFLKKYGCEW